jgi:hypothetical protein
MSTRRYFDSDTEEALQITMTTERSFQKLIAAAGGVYDCVKDGNVIFYASPGENETPISLYPHALRSTPDVTLAIKAAREHQKAAMGIRVRWPTN